MWEAIGNYIWQAIDYAWQILLQPWQHPQTLWMILPLVLILILIHLYFGRYRSESLGWNSALGNSISLLWILVILFRFLFENYPASEIFGSEVKKFTLMILLSLWVLLLLIFNFFHIVPKRFAFLISSADSTYVLAYIIISLIVLNFPLNLDVLLAVLFLFIVLIVFFRLIKKSVPMTSSAQQVMKKRKRKKAGKKAARTKKWHNFWRRIFKGED